MYVNLPHAEHNYMSVKITKCSPCYQSPNYPSIRSNRAGKNGEILLQKNGKVI